MAIKTTHATLAFALTAALATVCVSAGAQTDVFGNLVPEKGAYKPKSVRLPDYPNKVDSLGRRQGKWARKYENGHYAYTAEFVDGKPVGTVTRFDEQGNKEAELTYSDKDDTTRVKLYGPNKKIEATGQYIGKTRVGVWHKYNQEQQLIGVERYNSQGKQDGAQLLLAPSNGQVIETLTYRDGVPHGEWRQFYNAGTKKLVAAYQNGQLEGAYELFDEQTGQSVVRGVYKNGLSVGDWVYYDHIAKKYYTLKYNDKGVLQNPDVRDRHANEQLEYYESHSKGLVDPADYMATPEAYKPFK